MKPKSEMYKYFIKVQNDICNCKLCGQFVKTSGNTSNMKSHIRRKHPSVLSEKPVQRNQEILLLDQNTDDPSTINPADVVR